MDAFLLQLLNGLDKGGAYALIALGLTLIFGTLGVVNFAHGALFMLGGFCAVSIHRILTISRQVKDTSVTFFDSYKEIPYLEIWFGETGRRLIDYAVPLSVLLAILQFHGFVLREDDGRISVERDLLARSRSSAKRRRIQAWSLREGVLHRWFQRRSLRVDTATGQRGAQEQHTLKDIVPIATPPRCDELIHHFLPDAGWGALDWQPLHRHAWLRIHGHQFPSSLAAAPVPSTA